MSESESEGELSTPDLLRAAFAAGGKLADEVVGQWVPSEDGLSYQIQSDGKLFCWVDAEESIYEVTLKGHWNRIENGDAPQSLKLSLVTTCGKVESTEDDFYAQAELKTPGFGAFAAKWDIPVKHLRHLQKLDSQFICYVMNHFDPKKSKPKNALQKYTDSLLKFPQRWRVQAITESETEAQSILINWDIPITIGSSSESCEFVIEDVASEAVDIFSIEQEFFAQVKSGQISVDGLRVVAADGPVQLWDCTTLKINDHLLYVEIGSDSFLTSRREKFKSSEPPAKRQKA